MDKAKKNDTIHAAADRMAAPHIPDIMSHEWMCHYFFIIASATFLKPAMLAPTM